MSETTIKTVDITPPFAADPATLQQICESSIGKEIAHNGVKGTVISARISGSRILAEIKIPGRLLLG